MPSPFSIIILTHNEEIHLPRLLDSIRGLDCPVFVLDSGSADRTVDIARDFGATVLHHPFENHPKQWHHALTHFDIQTPWTLGLDADHIVLPELYQKLQTFRGEDIPADVNGIYLNRKNYFKGRWIKHGGYFPKYLLKLFRTGIGYSDLHENMDHRFIVPGRTLVWKDGYLKEENLKENEIRFWIEKHNRYSDLVAQEEVERKLGLRTQTVEPRFFGNPDQRIAWRKRLYWRLPLHLRAYLYFLIRYLLQRGFLDGPEGRLFHYLQGYWFRKIVDVKIGEKMKKGG